MWIQEQLSNELTEIQMLCCPSGDSVHQISMEEAIDLARGSSFEPVFSRLMVLKTLRGMEGVILCPRQNCDYAGWVAPNFTCENPLECELCGYTWRSVELLPIPRRILNFVKSLLEGREDSLSLIWKDMWTKACPGCNAPIEKSGGCPQMHCVRCQLHFCWLCMKPSRSHDTVACHLRLVMWNGLYCSLGVLLLYKLLLLCGNLYEVVYALSIAIGALGLFMIGVMLVGLAVFHSQFYQSGINWKGLSLYVLINCGIVLFTQAGPDIWEAETSFLLASLHLSILLVNLKFL